MAYHTLETYMRLESELSPALRSGRLDVCWELAERELKGLGPSPFDAVLNASIANSRTETASWLQEATDRAMGDFAVKAAYCEMNGFDVNPDEWRFNVFLYDNYSGVPDYDMLGGWKARGKRQVIRGLESVQKAYEIDIPDADVRFQKARGVGSILVILKFQMFIDECAARMERRTCPILAACHDSTFIFERGLLYGRNPTR